MNNFLDSTAGLDSTATAMAALSPASKAYWDCAYGYCIGQSDFQEIIANLKRFAGFMRDVS